MKTTGNKRRSPSPVFDAEGYQTDLTSLNGTPLPDLKRVKARPFGWGGVRTGAGRRSTGRRPVMLRLTPGTIRQLRATARKQGKTLSDLAEERLAVV
ncbi:MAG: hypothetical protein PHE83_04475 [Opitutaceae bacterium]|nr:hypothetical protein [Opitutaceae bacterium]